VTEPEREQRLARQVLEAGLVEERATKWARRYPGCARFTDSVDAGNFALASIVRAHDETRGGFLEFCRRRLDWAMLDAVRVEARQQRNDRAAQRASADLLALYRRDPTVAHLDQLRHLAEVLAAATVAAMTEESFHGGEDDMIAREEYATAHEVMKAALEALPKQHQKLFVLVYHEAKKLSQAKEELEVHQNTAERWHLQALAAIRRQMEKHGITHAPGRGGAPRVALSVLRGGKDP